MGEGGGIGSGVDRGCRRAAYTPHSFSSERVSGVGGRRRIAHLAVTSESGWGMTGVGQQDGQRVGALFGIEKKSEKET
jgi:hypothetical protein